MSKTFEEFLKAAFAHSPGRKHVLVYCGFCDELIELDQDCQHQRVKRWLGELQDWVDKSAHWQADNQVTND